jgi:hypothetical protein
MRPRTVVRTMLACAMGLSAASGQPVKDWLDRQLTDASMAAVAQKKPAQTQSVSLNHGSTTFVDQTSASDLLGVALNLSPVGGSRDGSGTVTASLYSIYTLATSQDPVKPSIYNAHSGLRTLFVTVGREESSSGAQNPTPQGTVYGVRWLPVNQRDASAIAKNPAVMKQFREAARAIAGATSEAASALANLLYDRLPEPKPSRLDFLRSFKTADDVQALVDRLPPADRTQVTVLVNSYRSRIGSADTELQKLVQMLSRRWQVAVDFQTIQRSVVANNDYQLELIADRAVNDRLFFTFNGSYLYSDSIKIGADTRTGRSAFELKYSLTQVSGFSLRSPLQLALSGESLLKQRQWQYHTQLQLVIPISTGVNLPFSLGYGKRPELLRQEEKDVYGKFGLTLDLSKIVSALKTAQ